MNSFVVGLIISFVSTFKRLVISLSIKQFGTNCRLFKMGRIVAFSKWDELTLGTNCRFLEFGANCRPTNVEKTCPKNKAELREKMESQHQSFDTSNQQFSELKATHNFFSDSN